MEKLKELSARTYKEQAQFTLNAFWDEWGQKESENVWDYAHSTLLLCVSIYYSLQLTFPLSHMFFLLSEYNLYVYIETTFRLRSSKTHMVMTVLRC